MLRLNFKHRRFQNKTHSVILGALFILITSACTQAPAPVTHYGVQDGAGSGGAHTMRAGDTIYNLSTRYNRPLNKIIARNAIENPRTVKVGQRIILPQPQTYTVRKGDTIYSIARLYDADPVSLAQVNNVYPDYNIYEGQVLYFNAKPEPEPPAIIADASIIKPLNKPEFTQPAVKKAPVSKVIPKRSSSKFLKPVNGSVVLKYGPKEGGLRNDGINYAAPLGAPVKAAENGRVVYVGNDLRGTGNLILIRHTDNWMSAYAHLNDFNVAQGDAVNRGQTIASVGKTGAVKTPQLHFELRKGTKAVNPAIYMKD